MNTKEIFIKYLNIIFVENKNGEGLSEILAKDFTFNDPFTKASGAKDFINNPATQNWIRTKKSSECKSSSEKEIMFVSFMLLVF